MIQCLSIFQNIRFYLDLPSQDSVVTLKPAGNVCEVQFVNDLGQFASVQYKGYPVVANVSVNKNVKNMLYL